MGLLLRFLLLRYNKVFAGFACFVCLVYFAYFVDLPFLVCVALVVLL